jgi:hypothetical protein
MKQRRLFSLSFTLIVAFALAPLAVSVLAQDQELLELKRKVAENTVAQNREDKIRAEMMKVVGAKIGFEMKVVKGAPYSAIAEAETIQTLADGNRIRNKTTTLVYRDGEGRTRREVVGKEQSLPTEVFISDPASGVNYSLDSQRRFALKAQVNLQELDLEKMKFAAEMEMKQREMKRQTQAGGQVVRAEDEEIVKKKRQPIVESLGQQIIEGVLCEGRRATFTIPAGEAGNELPITTVNEEWYSPELQVYVLTKQSDPRIGETIYRLTTINRSEPDRALFEVPADYTLKDESALPAKKKKRPEEEK